MAEQPSNNIQASAMATLLGQSSTNIQIDSLCGAANINKWSFYRPRPIQVNGTTKLVEFATKTNNWKLGDFRRYNHTALTPSAPDNFTRNYGPSGSTFSITFAVKVERLNIKELVPSTTPYITVKYYLSSSNRSSETSAIRTYTTAMSLSSESPPSGHSNNQTQAPSSSSQLVVDSTFPVSAITTPDDVLYCDIYISDISGNALVRFDDGYVDVNTHQYSNPIISQSGPNFTISGYTASFIVVNNGSSTCAGSDQSVTFGSSSASFYIHLVGLSGGTWYRLGASSISLRIDVGGTKYTLNTTSLSSSANTQEVTANFWGTGHTWAYDDIGEVEIVSASGITQGSVCTP